MLSYDALVEQAKIRNMPPAKMRGILREYLQILILKELNRQELGRKLYFTGGTYLRLVHNLKRFSEDLDFNTNKLNQKSFEELIEKVTTELSRIVSRINLEFTHWDNILVAKLIFPEVERFYNIISRHSKKAGIIIKLETNRPDWKIKSETQVISGFGETYPCICTDISALFADKIDAILKKKRGRHLYDVIFLLSNKFKINREALKKLDIKEDPLELVLSRIENISKKELNRQGEILRPFLFEESDTELIIQAHDIIPKLVEQYRMD
jgi:predicted nucleotidyltransferase component of viral defense system